MREHTRTLTPTLSLAEGEGAIFEALSPGGGEGQGEGEAHDAECVFVNNPR